MKKNLKYIIPTLIINTLIILNIINFKISFISFFNLIILSSFSLYLTASLTSKITISLHTNFLASFYKPNISENLEHKINNIYNIEQSIFIYFFTLLYGSLHSLIYFIYSFYNNTYLYIMIIFILTLGWYKYRKRYNTIFSNENYIKGINIIKLANKEDKEKKELKYRFHNYLIQKRKMVILEIIYLLTLFILLIIGKNIYLVTFVIPLLCILYKADELDTAYGYIRNYNNFYNIPKYKTLSDFNNLITLKNVNIHNFNDLTITFPKNHVCMIYGPSLSGKTTILDVLANRININNGEIIVDNKRLIHKKLNTSYMRHDDYLFSNSLKKLFLELNSKTNETRIHFWLKQVNAEYFTYDLQKIITKNGDKLTKEEQSKLKIALNLIKDSNILLFDEPFKYLDTNTIKRITANLRYLSNTIIITTNDYAHLKFADSVYIIDDNKLLYSGTYKDIPDYLERKYKI